MTNLTMPAACAALSEEEMTYTEGGRNFSSVTDKVNNFFDDAGIPTLIGVSVLAVLDIFNLYWGITTVRKGIQKNKDRNADFNTNAQKIISRGTEYTASYASKNVWNSVVTAYTFANLAVFWPVTALAVMTA